MAFLKEQVQHANVAEVANIEAEEERRKLSLGISVVLRKEPSAGKQQLPFSLPSARRLTTDERFNNFFPFRSVAIVHHSKPPLHPITHPFANLRRRCEVAALRDTLQPRHVPLPKFRVAIHRLLHQRPSPVPGIAPTSTTAHDCGFS